MTTHYIVFYSYEGTNMRKAVAVRETLEAAEKAVTYLADRLAEDANEYRTERFNAGLRTCSKVSGSNFMDAYSIEEVEEVI